MFGETYMTKTDCFGYSEQLKRCTILTETVCHCDTCSFYKTQEEYDRDRERYSPNEAEFERKRKGL